jgi:hypothetical protein
MLIENAAGCTREGMAAACPETSHLQGTNMDTGWELHKDCQERYERKDREEGKGGRETETVVARDG